MTQVVFTREAQQKPTRALAPQLEGSPTLYWSLLAWVGVAFTLVGATDLSLAWYPAGFGNPQWEFATVSAVLDGFPVFSLGLTLLLIGAIANGKRRSARLAGLVFFALAIGVVALAVIYATVVPLALRSVPDPQVRLGLLKAMAKTAVQVLVYPAVFVLLGMHAFKATAFRRVRIVND